MKPYLRAISLFILMLSLLLISSCTSTGIIYVNNTMPRAKLVLEKDPNVKDFYNANYSIISQNVFNENTKIILLKTGKNEIPLNSEVKDYAAYFILPNVAKESQLSDWKYLIKPDTQTNFTISNKGKVDKE